MNPLAAVLMGDDAEAVVVDLVEPTRALGFSSLRRRRATLSASRIGGEGSGERSPTLQIHKQIQPCFCLTGGAW